MPPPITSTQRERVLAFLKARGMARLSELIAMLVPRFVLVC